jgi:DNA-binding transcriptional MerR regulator
MNYRVEELARAAGLRVDTVRFYQGRGLIPPPRREGRVARYDERHLERLNRIRDLQEKGLTLALIRRVLEAEEDPSADAHLLGALRAERVGERTLTREQLADEAGVPDAILAAAQAAGLLEPLRDQPEERYTEADLRMLRSGLAILEAGFPLDRLLDLAVLHARHVERVADQAVELFDRYVRRTNGERPDESVTESFRDLLPRVTELVALHFQRTVVSRALERLEARGERPALLAALAASESSRLEVRWR